MDNENGSPIKTTTKFKKGKKAKSVNSVNGKISKTEHGRTQLTTPNCDTKLTRDDDKIKNNIIANGFGLGGDTKVENIPTTLNGLAADTTPAITTISIDAESNVSKSSMAGKLMPPPDQSQPLAQTATGLHDEKVVNTSDGAQSKSTRSENSAVVTDENEEIVDGFSISSYSTRNGVMVSWAYVKD